MTEQRQDVFRIADEIYRQRPSWVTFFREVLGVDGIVRQVYNTPETLSQFEQAPEFQRIQQMLAKLRENDSDLPGGPREPTRVITVRLPKSLHESLPHRSPRPSYQHEQAVHLQAAAGGRRRAGAGRGGDVGRGKLSSMVPGVPRNPQQRKRRDSERTYKPGSVPLRQGCCRRGAAIYLGS